MKTAGPLIVFALLVIIIVGVAVAVNKDQNKSSNLNNTADQNISSTANDSNNEVSNSNVSSSSDGIDKAALAKYLTDHGAILYGAYWCSHCKAQKELFGDALQYVTYYECDPSAENSKSSACQAAGIEAYPTWIINGQKYTGTKSLADLAKLIGFTY